MEDELLGIGRPASLSGLPVTALRFHDGVDVLRPATADPTSGHRFSRWSQIARPAVAHLRRREAGPADARREMSLVPHLLADTEITTTRCIRDHDGAAREVGRLSTTSRWVEVGVSADLAA